MNEWSRRSNTGYSWAPYFSRLVTTEVEVAGGSGSGTFEVLSVAYKYAVYKE